MDSPSGFAPPADFRGRPLGPGSKRRRVAASSAWVNLGRNQDRTGNASIQRSQSRAVRFGER